ncbi:MAG: CaiB/BaiF CoA-transferase family protein, partial [Dehalococcoidia bacterium]|nr:CaiB/BaiF CoA-transferase family protein [Dehalococcoidia bacterium]
SDLDASTFYHCYNRNKKGITLELSSPRGQEIFKQLVPKCDVVLENFRPGTLERWNLGYEKLKDVNPGIVLLRISAFGQTGPDCHQVGLGTTAQARSGYTYMCGYPDRPPLSAPLPLADYITGTFGALAVMIALYHRDAMGGGEGQCIDSALYEGLFRYMEDQPALYDKLGVSPERQGEEHARTAPLGIFQSKDGKWLAITAAGDALFRRFCQVMKRTDIAEEGLFCNQEGRGKYYKEINAIVREWVGRHTSRDVINLCEAGSVPCGPVQSMADIFTDPLFRARGNITEIEDRDLGTLKVPNVVPKFSLTPGQVGSGAPRLGEHNDEVLGGLLGYSNDKIDGLRASGAV